MFRWTSGLAVLVLGSGVALGDIISWHASSGVLPDDPSIPAESRFQGDGTASFLSMRQEYMNVNDDVGGSKVVVRKYVPGAITPGDSFAYQAEIRMNSHSRPTLDFGVALGLFDGARETVIMIASAAVGFAGDTEGNSFLNGLTHNLYTTDRFHTFRVTHESGDVHLYVDTFDTPVISVQYADLPAFGERRVDMLQSSGHSAIADFDIRAFAYNLDGTAIPEPPTLWLLGVAAFGLLFWQDRRKWQGS